jgi:hypothetical protein
MVVCSIFCLSTECYVLLKIISAHKIFSASKYSAMNGSEYLSFISSKAMQYTDVTERCPEVSLCAI